MGVLEFLIGLIFSRRGGLSLREFELKDNSAVGNLDIFTS
jgi:hypothetical protein